MMEYNEIGIKDSDDVLTCMENGASAYDLYQMYGDRIAELIACALDSIYAQYNPSNCPDPRED
jgi:hypothetical protein